MVVETPTWVSAPTAALSLLRIVKTVKVVKISDHTTIDHISMLSIAPGPVSKISMLHIESTSELVDKATLYGNTVDRENFAVI